MPPTRTFIWRSPAIKDWLSQTRASHPDYEHQRLDDSSSGRAAVLAELKRLASEAHDDARDNLRRRFRVTLDPLGQARSPTGAPVADPAAGYPEDLELQVLKGYFGELLAGLLAENVDPLQSADWEVPAFLFRFHLEVFRDLDQARLTGRKPRRQPGRTGDDALAFRRDDSNRIIDVLVCESKCTATHATSLLRAGHENLSDGSWRPADLPQLLTVLEESDAPESPEWVEAIESFLLLQSSDGAPRRSNLLLYVCGQRPIRKTSWIPATSLHASYAGQEPLAAIEVHIDGVDELVKQVYEG